MLQKPLLGDLLGDLLGEEYEKVLQGQGGKVAAKNARLSP